MTDLKKIFFLCILAVVIIGVIFYYLLNVPNTDPLEPTESESAAVTETQTEEPEEKHEMMDMGDESNEEGATDGNDVGMEFPIPDIESGSADAEASVAIDENAKVFNITGESFAFSQDEIRVSEGDTVVINFESTEGFHDWVVDEFNARTDRVPEGGKTSVTFVADRKGEFEYYCSVGSHRQFGMVGTLIVE